MSCVHPQTELARCDHWCWEKKCCHVVARQQCTLTVCKMADAHWGPMHMTFCYQSRHAHFSLQPWIIVLLSLNSNAPVKKKVHFGSKQENQNASYFYFSFATFVTKILYILSPQKELFENKIKNHRNLFFALFRGDWIISDAAMLQLINLMRCHFTCVCLNVLNPSFSVQAFRSPTVFIDPSY